MLRNIHHILRISLLALAAVFGLLQSAAQHELTIIATTDVHGNYFPIDAKTGGEGEGSLARVHTYVSRMAEACGRENLLLLDNGDILQGHPAAYFYNFVDTFVVHACARALNFIDYDAVTVGNHDIEAGHVVFDRWAHDLKMPVVAANVVHADSGEPYFKPYTIVRRAGLKIAVIGLLTPSIPKWVPEHLWTGMRFDDLVETAQHWVSVVKTKERPDLIIGLFHSGVGDINDTTRLAENASLRIARDVPGFDAIVCGHDHREALESVRCTDGRIVPVINPAAHCRKLAKITLNVKKRGRKVSVESAQCLNVDLDIITPSEAYQEQFKPENFLVRTYIKRDIGECAETMSTRPAFVGPSAFIDFIHTLQLKISGADISFTAPLSLDAEIKQGPIKISDMFSLYEYENQLYRMRLTGSEIRRYLEYSYGLWVETMQSANDHLLRFREAPESIATPWQRLAAPAYSFDSAAGLRYEVDVTKPAGSRVSILSLADGTPFSEDSVYTVAINSYRGGGGGGHLEKGVGLSKEEIASRIEWRTSRDLRAYLTDEIKEICKTTRDHKLRPKSLGQWRFVPEEWATPAGERDLEILFK